MNPLNRKRQADIVIDYLTEIEIRIRFRKPHNLSPPFSGLTAVGRLLTELYTQAESCLNRKFQLLKASVTSYRDIAIHLAVNPDEMSGLLRKDLNVKIRRQNL